MVQSFQPKKSENSIFTYFLSQPHQPFFLMGIIWAIVTMLPFMLGFKGILPLGLDPIVFHAYPMLFIVFSHFFHGFLLTTFPRFCMTQPVPYAIYTRLYVLYEAGALLFILGALFFAPLAIIGVLTLFAGHLFAISNFRLIYRAGGSPEKVDPFWLLVAHASGLAAHLIFVVGIIYDTFGIHFGWQPLAVGIGIYLYLIFLTFTVAQRMIPFFSHVMVNKPQRFVPIVYSMLAIKATSFTFGLNALDIVVTLVLAGYLFKEFLNWKLPVFSSPAILWVLHLGLFWLPAGLLIDAVSTLAELWFQISFLFAGMHLVAIGFVTTILIGFGTRVTLGHSGQVPHADKISVGLFWLTEAVVLVRFLYSLGMGLGLDLFWLFDLAATLWTVLFIAWGIKFGPVLFRGKTEG